MKSRILFFCPLPPPIGGQALISEIVFNQIQPKFIINTNLKSKYLGTISVLLQTFWLIVFHKIDLVYFTCTRSKMGALKDFFLLFLCHLRKIRVINHLHGNEVMDLFKDRRFGKLTHYFYNFIDATIFVTEHQKATIPASLTNMERIVIPNCYDPVLDDCIRTLDDSIESTKLLFISYLMKSKGILVVLDVFERLAESYPNLTLNIAGDFLGDDYMSKSEITDVFHQKYGYLEKKFPGRIHYLGVVMGEEKKALYLTSDILLFPSFFKTESFGLVNVEGMRTGNVVITTNHNFLPELVSEKEGFIVKTNDIESTYVSIKFVLDHPDLMRQIQQHNMEHAKLQYAPDRLKFEVQAVFNRFMEK